MLIFNPLNQFEIYPVFFIKFWHICIIINNFSPAKFSLLDSKGATIKSMLLSNGKTTLNLTALSKGIYYYKVVFEDGTTQASSINKN